MGYFPNGTAGMIYDDKYCNGCVHMLPEPLGCPCHTAHLIWNYDEANNENSILHKMIPRNEDGFNEQCMFFKKRISEDECAKEIAGMTYICKVCGDKIDNVCSRCAGLLNTAPSKPTDHDKMDNGIAEDD